MSFFNHNSQQSGGSSNNNPNTSNMMISHHERLFDEHLGSSYPSWLTHIGSNSTSTSSGGTTHHNRSLNELIDPLGLNAHFSAHGGGCCLYYRSLSSGMNTDSDDDEDEYAADDNNALGNVEMEHSNRRGRRHRTNRRKENPNVGEEDEEENQRKSLLAELLLKQREEFLLETSQDKCMQYKSRQKYRITDLPADTMLNALSYLYIDQVVHMAPVCKYFKQLYQHDRLWEPFVKQKSPYVYNHAIQIATSVDDAEVEAMLFRHSKIQRHNTGYGGSRYKEWKEKRKAVRKNNASSKQAHNREASNSKAINANKANRRKQILSANCLYYTAFKRRVLTVKRRKEERASLKAQEERRKHYEKVLRTPQKWCELFYIGFYTPLFFMILLASTLCAALYLDNIIPSGVKVASRNLALIMTPFLSVSAPLFIVATCATILSEYLRVLRWNTKFDTLFPAIYLGSLWLPLLLCLYAMKVFMLPDIVPWRAICAPQWAYTCIYMALSIFVHKKFSILKWDVDQKVVYGLMAAVNMCVSFTTGFLTAKLDESLGPQLMYTSFVFSPIWLTLLLALIAIPIGAYVFMREEGPKLTMFLYFPLTCAFVIPFIVFFLLLALKLDGIIHWHYMIVFSPLLAWEVIWFTVSVVFAFLWARLCL